MSISFCWRSALILTALACFAGPSQAAPDADTPSTAETAAPLTLHKQVKRQSRPKKHTGRISAKMVTNSEVDRKTKATEPGEPSTAIPPFIANAKAQWQDAETPTGKAAKAMSARAADILMAAAQPQPDTQIVAADQLNDLDRALQPSSPPASAAPAAPLSMAAADTAAPADSSPAVAKGGSAWDQTSLIGKIFIGFGALLTMASAARMFMT
ncbi:MAG TPA: hypothetical protein VJV58_05860 [Bradyrhizobium sp.]|uniref:hypothetical protein n=1 Tax=Bradyrhizobium sp. TaxID=376 RepID=UPI002B4833FF|nr:hypothetical protein [Bradyrhizobium sp.]HKO70437.1 hypothetical protein [Bradyrhizobium sp.]